MDDESLLRFSQVDVSKLPDLVVRQVVEHIHLERSKFYNSVLESAAVKPDLASARGGDVKAARLVGQRCQEFLLEQEGPGREEGDFVLPASQAKPAQSAVSSVAPRPTPELGLVTGLQTPVPPPAVSQNAAPSGGDDDDGSVESSDSGEIFVNLPGAVSGDSPAAPQKMRTAIEARAAAFLADEPTSHPALPDELERAVRHELQQRGVLGFQPNDAPPLPARTEGLVKAFSDKFLVPSTRGALPASVAKQEGALYARAADSLKLLSLLTAARVAVRASVFGEQSERMAGVYMSAVVELLVKEVNEANFSRAQLMLTNAPPARELFVATAAAASAGREHITLSQVYEPLLAASQTAKLWAPPASAARASGASAPSSASTSGAAGNNNNNNATPKKPRNRTKNNKKNNNNSKPTSSTSDAKPPTPAKSPAKSN